MQQLADSILTLSAAIKRCQHECMQKSAVSDSEYDPVQGSSFNPSDIQSQNIEFTQETEVSGSELELVQETYCSEFDSNSQSIESTEKIEVKDCENQPVKEKTFNQLVSQSQSIEFTQETEVRGSEFELVQETYCTEFDSNSQSIESMEKIEVKDRENEPVKEKTFNQLVSQSQCIEFTQETEVSGSELELVQETYCNEFDSNSQSIESTENIEVKDHKNNPIKEKTFNQSVSQSQSIEFTQETEVRGRELEQFPESSCTESDSISNRIHFTQMSGISDNNHKHVQKNIFSQLDGQSQMNEIVECVNKSRVTASEYKIEPDNFIDNCNVRTAIRLKEAKDILTPKVVSVLDKSRISSKNAAFLINAILEAINLNAEDYQISKFNIHNKRQILRQIKCSEIKKEFGTQKLSNLIVHWDVKELLDINGNGKVDCITIVLSYNGISKLISVSKLESVTGKAQADAIYDALHEWGVLDSVTGICCDTTSFNLGNRNGAAVSLEHLLEKDLLYFPCRRHILELLLRAVFEKLILATNGPTVPMFERFRQVWSNIDKTMFESGVSEPDIIEIFVNELEEIEFNIRRNLTCNLEKEDKELLCLSLLFIGIKPQENYQFNKPESTRNAQWLSMAIYSLKIFLFRKGFLLSKRNISALRQICIFIVKIYIKYWFVANKTEKAANNELNLIKDCNDFRIINENISQIALHKVLNHLWYLNPENVAMAFYDVDITVKDKKKMVLKLLIKDYKDEEEGYENKKAVIQISQVPNICEQGIEQFISPKSLNFFKKLSLNVDWINEDPANWERNSEYTKGRNIIRSIKVVNDITEKNIHLFENYKRLLSKDDDQMLYIAQLIEAHRKKYHLVNKKDTTK